MKLLKNFFEQVKETTKIEKELESDIRTVAKDKAHIYTTLIYLPLYLIGINLFVFIKHLILIVVFINLLFFLTFFTHQFIYYRLIDLKNYNKSVLKAVSYSLIATLFLWLAVLLFGGIYGI